MTVYEPGPRRVNYVLLKAWGIAVVALGVGTVAVCVLDHRVLERLMSLL